MFKKILFTLMIGLFLVPSFAKADGGMMPHPDYWIYETGQKAAIVYQNGTETLVLQTSFQGDAKDFAYIVPTPSKPEVTKISDDIFTNLAELTQQEYRVLDAIPMASLSGNQKAEESVTVVEEKQVGMYEIKVLTATDATALYDWLKENNFIYPESKKYILDDYIQNNWFFTTAKISTSAITEDVETKLKQGALTPLKFVFETQNPVYPLKISAVVDDQPLDNNSIMEFNESNELTNAKDYYYPSSVPITLYIFADHKKEISGFTTDYASWIKKNEIEKLAKDDVGNPWVKSEKKMYLTKLSKYTSYKNMTNDLFADNADNNKTVGVPTVWERIIDFLSGIGLVVVYGFFILLFFILCFWQFTLRSKRCHLICWILQILSFLVTAVPLLLIYIYAILNLGKGYYYGYSTFVSEGLVLLILSVFFIGLPLVMIVLMLAERYVQKKSQKTSD